MLAKLRSVEDEMQLGMSLTPITPPIVPLYSPCGGGPMDVGDL